MQPKMTPLQKANFIDAHASAGNEQCKKLVEGSECNSMTQTALKKKGMKQKSPQMVRIRFQDDDGGNVETVEYPVMPGQKTLTINRDGETFKIALGELNPIYSISGVQGRLSNMGYGGHEDGGEIGEITIETMQRLFS